MLISIVNRSTTISDEELLNAVRAINRQLREDFEPYWSINAQMRVETAIASCEVRNAAELRGDAVMYLLEEADVQEALGYHDKTCRGIPCGFVFLKLARALKENWTVTLSHEAIELVADAQANLLVRGPHPADAKRIVYHYFELCDAVQDETYEIDGITVSNFVLPGYFTPQEEEGMRNDFLNRRDKHGHTLKSFGVKPGGYIGFFDPESGKEESFEIPRDKVAKARKTVKAKVAGGRTHGRKNKAANGTV